MSAETSSQRHSMLTRSSGSATVFAAAPPRNRGRGNDIARNKPLVDSVKSYEAEHGEIVVSEDDWVAYDGKCVMPELTMAGIYWAVFSKFEMSFKQGICKEVTRVQTSISTRVYNTTAGSGRSECPKVLTVRTGRVLNKNNVETVEKVLKFHLFLKDKRIHGEVFAYDDLSEVIELYKYAFVFEKTGRLNIELSISSA